jgi:hypothetical protein
MKAAILHDEHGRIISASKIGDLKAAGSKFTRVGMVPGPGQRLIEIELNAEDAKRPLRELHSTYQVNVLQAKLVKKTL